MNHAITNTSSYSHNIMVPLNIFYPPAHILLMSNLIAKTVQLTEAW